MSTRTEQQLRAVTGSPARWADLVQKNAAGEGVGQNVKPQSPPCRSLSASLQIFLFPGSASEVCRACADCEAGSRRDPWRPRISLVDSGMWGEGQPHGAGEEKVRILRWSVPPCPTAALETRALAGLLLTPGSRLCPPCCYMPPQEKWIASLEIPGSRRLGSFFQNSPVGVQTAPCLLLV